MGCGGSNDKDKNARTTDDGPAPQDWPLGRVGKYLQYDTWALDPGFHQDKIFIAEPENEDQIVQVCNWAHKAGFTVRAVGVHHNWSPITIAPNQDGGAKVILLDMTKHMKVFHGVEPVKGKEGMPDYGVADFQPGIGNLAFLAALEKATNGGHDKIGYGVPHLPAPDSITVGGMMAIDGHGTAYPDVNARDGNNHGTLSNRVVSMRCVVWNKEKSAYECQDIARDHKWGPAVACHLGRCLVTRAKMRVEKNYYMSCKSFMNIPSDVMFAPQDGGPNVFPEKSMGWFMDQFGRAEAIWYPFTKCPWLKVWEVCDEKPAKAREVTDACNYPFSDQLPTLVTDLFKSLAGDDISLDQWLSSMASYHSEMKEIAANDQDSDDDAPALTVISEGLDLVRDTIKLGWGNPAMAEPLGELMYDLTVHGLKASKSSFIWGPSKNTLIYVRDTTLRVTANGYSVQMKRENVQRGLNVFTTIFEGMMNKYKGERKFPIACPLEIRVTGIDQPEHIDANFASPWLSSVNDEQAKKHGWDIALWIDVLSLPGAKHSNEFYEEMEQALMAHPLYNGEEGLLRPEWSKGWGYSAETGAWSKKNFRDHTRDTFSHFKEACAAFKEMDEKSLFTNAWLDNFME